MGKVRVAGFAVSIDGFGAGPEQSLEHGGEDCARGGGVMPFRHLSPCRQKVYCDG